jgi:hypothetical protein
MLALGVALAGRKPHLRHGEVDVRTRVVLDLPYDIAD